MSFDEYANHIYQKHRLAVALAILKSKPAKVDTEKYLNELKSKIDDKMDDDITVNSDDFLMDNDVFNDSVNILKDFDPEFVSNNENLLTDSNVANEKQIGLPENLSQITYYNSSQTESPENIPEHLTNTLITQDEYNFNQKNTTSLPTVNKEFNNQLRNVGQCKVIDNQSSNSNVIVDNEIQHSINKPLSESMDITYYDSQKTVLYTVPGFTQNFTHYSPSQNNIVIPDKYIYNLNKNKDLSTGFNKDIDGGNGTVAENMSSVGIENQYECKGFSASNNIVENATNREQIEYVPTMNMTSQRNDNNSHEIQNGSTNTINKGNMNEIDFSVNRDTEAGINQNIDLNSQNINDYFDEIRIINENENRNSFFDENIINPEVETDMEHIANEPMSYNQSVDYFSQNIENRNTENVIEKAVDKTKANNEKVNQNDEKYNQLTTTPSINNSSQQNKARREEYKITEEYNTEEIISYKVLEEFNKVKSFLNRRNRRMSDGYSTDSGYRSDSQIRSSNRSALQLSGNWLNQSGCCLFNYIMQCPLVATTRDITNEIAQVLSQLIDKLHEEEIYPSFLEDILETVNVLLREVYEGGNGEASEFLKKDESVQRILLLNKSIHIQKHSIEKISNILETFHSKLTENDSTYELSNIDEIENITYIFHILEILLKKYLKNQELLSQTSTQNSQDDEKILKKSSITDIWRKKWNPSQKVFEGSREKKCVLKTCSDILNRIVVDCVSGYSLVAYSALKCFNSMQH